MKKKKKTFQREEEYELSELQVTSLTMSWSTEVTCSPPLRRAAYLEESHLSSFSRYKGGKPEVGNGDSASDQWLKQRKEVLVGW